MVKPGSVTALDGEGTLLLDFSDVCSACRHWNAGTGPDRKTCAAFPDRIPDEIWRGENDHRQSYYGDHGLRFEPLESEANRAVA